jgi:hypothetical protein
MSLAGAPLKSSRLLYFLALPWAQIVFVIRSRLAEDQLQKSSILAGSFIKVSAKFFESARIEVDSIK